MMKALFLILFLPYLFFKPDVIDDLPYIKTSSGGIFKVKPKDPEGFKIPHANKKVYSRIINEAEE